MRRHGIGYGMLVWLCRQCHADFHAQRHGAHYELYMRLRREEVVYIQEVAGELYLRKHYLPRVDGSLLTAEDRRVRRVPAAA
jgi:hypothetical protein